MMRILHVVSVMDVGGMESFIMNLYRHMDRSRIQFDFLTHHGRRGAFEEEIEALGGRVYHIPLMDDLNLVRYRAALGRLFGEHPEYRIVHGHLGSTALWYLGEAERQGVPWRILHSHVPARPPTVKGYVKDFLFHFSPRHANIRLACSTEAGRYQFKGLPFEVIPNGIDVDRFRFDSAVRQEVRKRLGLGDAFVVGHVGRFHVEKNHAYLLRLFKALHDQEPKAALLLIGTGELMERTKALAEELGLGRSVCFLGLQKDCAPFYQAMDAFVLPSLYEGLPLTGVEAQCAGLPCLFTDQASPALGLSPSVRFLPADEAGAERWVKALREICRRPAERKAPSPAVMAFDAARVAQAMAERYEALWEKKA